MLSSDSFVENSIEEVARREALSDSIKVFERMVEIRLVEEKIQVLFEQGYLRGSTHLSNGQEAVALGIARAARLSDTVSCTYRGHGIALALGVTPRGVLGEVAGRVTGCAGGLGGSMHLTGPSVGLLPTAAIVGASLPLAAGAALAAQVRGDDRAAIAVFGDGSANIGAFHETLNLASIWRLPVVFICENNLYGEYSRIQLTTPIEDLALRAASYAIPGAIIDGQDVDAVTESVSQALERARNGEGPSLLEMKTYRYSGHSRSDPATYRPPGEYEVWKRRDPIEMFGARLVEIGAATNNQLEEIRNLVAQGIESDTEVVLASSEPELDEMFRHVYFGSDSIRSLGH